jgi:multicomponent Na+:H+ antiporter subunit F
VREFLLFSALFVLATVAVGLLRLLHGPADADRIMSAQLLGTGGIAVLLLLGAAGGAPSTIDVALTLAVLAAFASAAFANAATERDDATSEEDETET